MQRRARGKAIARAVNFRHGSLPAVARAVLLAALLVALGGCSLTPGPDIHRIDRVELPDGRALPLPANWPAGEPDAGLRVETRFELDDAADSLAVYVSHTTLVLRAFFNGQFVYESGDSSSPVITSTSYRATPLFRLPAELQRDGTNSLVLEVLVPRGATIRSLGPIYLGDAEAIERLEQRRWRAFHGGPIAIGVILVAIGAVALGSWSGRRDKELFMLLAAGCLLWALQILLYQWPTPLLPGRHWALVATTMYAWWPILIAVFFLRFAHRQSRRLERWAAVLIVGAAPLIYLGSALGWAGWASIVLRLCVLVYIGIGLAAILRYALQLRTVTGYVLLASGIIGVGVAVYDFVRSLFPEADRVLVLNPYSSLSIVLVAGWMLLERYHRAYANFELLNRDLERRVAAANVELHRRLEQVEAARAAAEQASIAKSRFFAAASHDLRQPLHALGLFATGLREVVGNPQGRDLAQRIGDSIAALDRLFDELLDLSRLDAGTVEVRPLNVALQPLLWHLAAAYEGEAGERGLRLQVRPTSLAVHTDALLLERLLSNLLSNALRYTHHGGVLIGARRRGRHVLLQVWDTGIGIPPEQVELVFDEFYQVGNPGRDRRQGLGLGLAIVRRLTALLGIRLDLRSRVGRGTCFALTLPAATGPASTPAAEETATQDHAFAGKAALVIDDDVDIRDATASLLERWGFEAHAASGYPAACDWLQAGFRPDVLLADLRLGEAFDGIDTVEALRRSLGTSIPALLISGDTGARELARVKDSGLLLLTKPVTPARLRSVLLSLLSPS